MGIWNTFRPSKKQEEKPVGHDCRDDFIARVVRGKSFVDVGGLWGTVSEKVSVAHSAGAAQLTMIDIAEKGNALWQSFEARMREKGIQGYKQISADILTLSENLSFDVVHSSGVLYHVPDPLGYLNRLQEMTREHLVLTSCYTAEEVRNAKGVLHVPAYSAIYVPGLAQEERAVLAEYWGRYGDMYGITNTYTYKMSDYSPLWWLPTRHTLRKLAETVGFEILDEGLFWHDNALVLLLKKVGR
jgi:hypothetical protein